MRRTVRRTSRPVPPRGNCQIWTHLSHVARSPPRPRPAHIPPSVNDHTDRAPVAGNRCRRPAASPHACPPFPPLASLTLPPPHLNRARRDSELHRSPPREVDDETRRSEGDRTPSDGPRLAEELRQGQRHRKHPGEATQARGPLRATQKRDYGKVPKYLQTIKSQIAAEREIIAEYHRQQEEAEHGTARAMSEEERDELLVELKMKWAKLNRAYGGLPFSLDVPSHQRKKEQLEHEMTQLEKDIKTLQGRQVVVVEDGQLK